MDHSVTFQNVKRKFWDPELHTTVIRGVGRRAVCECGERSRALRTRRELREWTRTHLDHVQ